MKLPTLAPFPRNMKYSLKDAGTTLSEDDDDLLLMSSAEKWFSLRNIVVPYTILLTITTRTVVQ